MAIKDWEKINTSNNNDKRILTYRTIRKYPTEYIWVVPDITSKKRYLVVSFNNNHAWRKGFKTEKEAIKFMKDYMKKH